MSLSSLGHCDVCGNELHETDIIGEPVRIYCPYCYWTGVSKALGEQP